MWRQVTAFGGEQGYYYADFLWFLRRLLDWVVGGPSFRRRRRDPEDLRVGDVVDSWRAIAVEPGQRLTLLMEMKGPGAGVLEFVIRDLGDRRTVSAHRLLAPGRAARVDLLVFNAAGASVSVQGPDPGDRAAGGAGRREGTLIPSRLRI